MRFFDKKFEIKSPQGDSVNVRSAPDTEVNVANTQRKYRTAPVPINPGQIDVIQTQNTLAALQTILGKTSKTQDFSKNTLPSSQLYQRLSASTLDLVALYRTRMND